MKKTPKRSAKYKMAVRMMSNKDKMKKIILLIIIALAIGIGLAELYIKHNCAAFVNQTCIPFRNDVQRSNSYPEITEFTYAQ